MAHQARKASHSVHTETPNLEDNIRRRAYELYEERGREDGHDLDDWLRAEDEVRKGTGRTVAA